MDSSLGDGSDAPMMGGDMPPMDDGSMDGMGEDLGNDQMDGMGNRSNVKGGSFASRLAAATKVLPWR